MFATLYTVDLWQRPHLREMRIGTALPNYKFLKVPKFSLVVN